MDLFSAVTISHFRRICARNASRRSFSVGFAARSLSCSIPIPKLALSNFSTRASRMDAFLSASSRWSSDGGKPAAKLTRSFSVIPPSRSSQSRLMTSQAPILLTSCWSAASAATTALRTRLRASSSWAASPSPIPPSTISCTKEEFHQVVIEDPPSFAADGTPNAFRVDSCVSLACPPGETSVRKMPQFGSFRIDARPWNELRPD